MAPGLSLRVRRHVVDVDLQLDVDRTPVTVVFGHSGAGKTTLLRCVAGLDRPDPGSRISLGDEAWDEAGVHVPSRQRRVGLLFQDHALFPHLDVTENVAYGLHRVARRDRPAHVRAALRAAGAAHLAGRPTRQLSGGEAQRVALARALAPRPRLLLLDEPLSALDAPTRSRLRGELRRLLVGAGVPALVVTHDRAEALALGDQVIVLVEGRVHQQGAVAEVFSRPADPEVAHAVEMETVAPGVVVGATDGLIRVRVGGVEVLAVADPAPPADAEVLVCIRAEEVALRVESDDRRASPRNHLPAVVTDLADVGPLVRVDLDAGFPLRSFVTRPTVEDLDLVPGRRITAVFKAPAVHLVVR